MSEDYEEEQIASNQIDDENYKIRPPSRKKHDEELEKLVIQIREREAELEKIKSAGGLNITSELKNLKLEKSAAISKRKQIDVELEKLKKILPEKMRQLGQLESSLIYKSEEKINAAIQRLEWNLKVQPFKLMEEKKIVSEIDRLKRSKKTLVQYLALKQEISAIRDMQRCMREERDMYFQAVGKLNSDEDKLRRDNMSAKTTASVLKLQIDELYESKRQVVANYKRQMEDYQDARDKQRKGSWKKRDDYRKSAVIERRKQQAELEIEKTPYEKYISWCNSLIKVLSRYNSLSMQEPSLESLSPASSLEEPEPAEEIDDGQYVLLKRNDEGLELSLGTRRPSKKNRRPRKQSSIKKVTLSTDMVQQLMELGLKAPNSVSEVAEAIESLRLKKVLLEREQQASEVASDAGISATESLICEMSRQGSKTESYEGALETNPGEHVYAEILHGCHEEESDQPECWQAEGAVGGCEAHSGILSPNSDSTVEGDTGSSESHSSVCENPESSRYDLSRPVVIVYAAEEEGRRERMPDEKAKPEYDHDILQTINYPSAQSQIKLHSEKVHGQNVPSDVDYSHLQSSTSLKSVSCLSKPENGGIEPQISQPGSGKKPTSLCLSPLPSSSGQQVLPSASSVDIPSLSPTVGLPQSGLRSVWNSSADHSRSAHQKRNFLHTPSPKQTQHMFAGKLLNPSPSAPCKGLVQQTVTAPTSQVSPVLIFDNEDFPSLSQSLSQPRRGSNLSTRSSSGSSVFQEQVPQPCDQHPGLLKASQITSVDISSQPYSKSVFPTQQSHQSQGIPENKELTDSHQASQKLPEVLSHSNKPLSMSQIPLMDKSSTEKWVESSVAFVKDFIPSQCEDDLTGPLPDLTGPLPESTRL